MADIVLDFVQPGLQHIQPPFHPDHAERHEQERERVEQCRYQQDERHPPGEPVGQGEGQRHAAKLAPGGGGNPSACNPGSRAGISVRARRGARCCDRARRSRTLTRPGDCFASLAVTASGGLGTPDRKDSPNGGKTRRIQVPFRVFAWLSDEPVLPSGPTCHTTSTLLTSAVTSRSIPSTRLCC